MKLYQDFEKVYKLITESTDFDDNIKCLPEELEEDKIIDKMITFYTTTEDYEKCNTLLKIKCWRARQDKKYNL